MQLTGEVLGDVLGDGGTLRYRRVTGPPLTPISVAMMMMSRPLARQESNNTFVFGVEVTQTISPIQDTESHTRTHRLTDLQCRLLLGVYGVDQG